MSSAHFPKDLTLGMAAFGAERSLACLGFARSGLPRYGYGDDARVVFLLDFRVTGAPLW
jgi:hypothetical protein